jgi:hypothetical protein
MNILNKKKNIEEYVHQNEKKGNHLSTTTRQYIHSYGIIRHPIENKRYLYKKHWR